MSTTISCGIHYRCCTVTPIADAMNLPFHGQLIRYVATVVFLSTIWFATKDNKQGFKKKIQYNININISLGFQITISQDAALISMVKILCKTRGYNNETFVPQDS